MISEISWTSLWTTLSILDAVLVALAIVSILRRRREPRAMLVWILALLLLPFIGLILFVVMGDPRIARTQRRRYRQRQKLEGSLKQHIQNLKQQHGHPISRAGLAENTTDLMTIAARISRTNPTISNSVSIYHEDEQNFQAILAAIEQAKHHVHLEYYIFQPDETGKTLRDLLVRKANEGIRVRVLVDYIGTWNWPRSFRRSFVDGGVEVAFFLPVVPWRGRWRVNMRNHRKILVVDGLIGFTGSQNIGDEYRGRLAKYGPWRDTHMRLVGPAVHQLQEIFIEDWHYTTGEDVSGDEYFPNPTQEGDQIVQVVASGPDSTTHLMHHLFLSAVSGARKSVTVLTPYFAPDTTMILALQSAAYRGVRVQLLIPTPSNHWMILWSGRSFYEELSQAGVEVYEYDHALLHSKVVVVDDSWAMVGSANMDQRSFHINFEVTTILYNELLAKDLQDDFEALLTRARRITYDSLRQWSFRESLLLGIARLAAPLL